MKKAEAADWTDEVVRRFWAFKQRDPKGDSQYFSKMVGRGVARFAELSGLCHGRALDFGCGPGYLLDELIPRFSECHGVDFSPEAVAAADQRLEGRPGWRGATALRGLPTHFGDGSFGFVSCVETIEHLRDDQLAATVSEIHRLLEPGGAALFTTPNAENLERALCFCPFCETAFHEWQHLRSFTAESLRQLLQGAGFDVHFVRGIDLWRFQWDGRTSSSLGDRVRRKLRWTFDEALDRMRPRPILEGRRFRYLLGAGSHLCALATRPSSAGTFCAQR